MNILKTKKEAWETAFNHVASVAVTQFVHQRPLSNVQQQG